MLPSCPGEVDPTTGKGAFHSHLPDRQEPAGKLANYQYLRQEKIECKNRNLIKICKQNLRAACLIQIFLTLLTLTNWGPHNLASRFHCPQLHCHFLIGRQAAEGSQERVIITSQIIVLANSLADLFNVTVAICSIVFCKYTVRITVWVLQLILHALSTRL